MGAYINGVYHEHTDASLNYDALKAQAAAQHARIDEVLERIGRPRLGHEMCGRVQEVPRQGWDAFPPYSTVLDKPNSLAPASLEKP